MFVIKYHSRYQNVYEFSMTKMHMHFVTVDIKYSFLYKQQFILSELMLSSSVSSVTCQNKPVLRISTVGIICEQY